MYSFLTQTTHSSARSKNVKTLLNLQSASVLTDSCENPANKTFQQLVLQVLRYKIEEIEYLNKFRFHPNNDTKNETTNIRGSQITKDVNAHSNKSSNNRTDGYLSEKHVDKFISVYIFPIIFFSGVIGNLLSLFVLLGKKMRKNSSSTYLSALTVVDALVLTFAYMIPWIENFGFVFENVSIFTCIGRYFLAGFLSNFSVWLIVAVTVERFIAVCFPLKAVAMCRKGNALKVIAALLVFFSALNIYDLWTTKLIDFYDQKSKIHYLQNAVLQKRNLKKFQTTLSYKSSLRRDSKKQLNATSN
ncbi:hypothetical protein HELRODRAFT_177651 [Helobdella robusta]|uniref:G-protein coupled receptors family 1 profile domain-containing protein n=1 Tax=Helobdella robusta TaxID=6412 RepID=T1FC07_HELRO|nr:hypothetical protein HELRODRAFT_177651 [Helobdella robusta]ESN97980.1 hypothetical protein HELRODRAFT_177651 [Helobdella robusta]